MATSPVTLSLSNLDQDRVALHHRYSGQVDPQPAHVEIDEDGTVTADYSGEIGSAVPMLVWHKRTLRVPVAAEVDCADLAAYLRGGGLPLLQAIHNGHSVHWDGSNHVGALTDEAEQALEDLADGLQDLPTVEVWTVEDWLYGCGQTLADTWPADQTLDQAVAECQASYSATPGVVLGDARRALLNRARDEWREHPGNLARVHVDALRECGFLSALQAADWADEYAPSIEGILARYNVREVARDYPTAQQFVDQVVAAEPVGHLDIEQLQAAARAWYSAHVNAD